MKEVKTVKNMSSLIFRILEMNSDNSASKETHIFANFPLICFSSPIYDNILRILSYTLLDFWYANYIRNSDRAGMNKISCKVSIFYLYSDWKNPATEARERIP